MTGIKNFADSESVDLDTKFEKTDKTHGVVLQLLYENNPDLAEKLKGHKIVRVS
jgi:hypothetical protein